MSAHHNYVWPQKTQEAEAKRAFAAGARAPTGVTATDSLQNVRLAVCLCQCLVPRVGHCLTIAPSIGALPWQVLAAVGETLSQPSRSRRASQAASPDRKVKTKKKAKKKRKGAEGAEEGEEEGKKKRKKKLVKKTKRSKSKSRVRKVRAVRDRSPEVLSPRVSRPTTPRAGEYATLDLGLTEDDSNAFNAVQAYKSMLASYQNDVESVNPEELRMARAEAVRLQALARHHAKQRAEAEARKRFEAPRTQNVP